MAKRLKRPDGDLSAEGRLVTAIGDLATGRLREVIASQVDEVNFEFYDPPSDTSASACPSPRRYRMSGRSRSALCS